MNSPPEVADKTNSPLYSIEAKELSLISYRLSDSIETIMSRANEWNSIILLNGISERLPTEEMVANLLLEADVYLADRSSNNISSNNIVSSKQSKDPVHRIH